MEGMTENMNFGSALGLLKHGYAVARAGWNGRGMWIKLHFLRGDMTLPYIYMKTAQGDFVPWVASQSDLLSEDWGLVDAKL